MAKTGGYCHAAYFAAALASVAGLSWADDGQSAFSWHQFTHRITLNRDGTSSWIETYELRANNEAGVPAASRVGESYDASTEHLEIVEAYTRKADGEIVAVAPGAIFDLQPDDAGGFITSQRQKLILFPNFEVGDTAHFVIKRQVEKLEFQNKPVLSGVLNPAAAYEDYRIEITAPRDLKLNASTNLLTFSTEDKADTRLYRWTYKKPNPEPQDEIWVSPRTRWPGHALSAFADYRDLGNAYAREMNAQLTLTPEIIALADKIAPTGLDRRTQAEQLYLWVSRHVRYVAVEIGRGGRVPHPAALVLANGYGDCKDHDTLFQALLKAKGIKAESVLINFGNEYQPTVAPTFDIFNHVITYLPEFRLYADSTSQTAPFGVLPFGEHGKPVVHAKEDGSATGTSPLMTPDETTLRTVTDETVAADGTISGTTTITTTGPSSIWLRDKALEILRTGPIQAAQELLSQLGYRHGTGEFDIPPPLAAAPSYALTGRFQAEGWREKLAAQQSFEVPVGFDFADAPGDGPMGPLHPLRLKDDAAVPCNPVRQEQDITLRLPASFSFREIPGDARVETAHILYTATWQVGGNTLTLHRRFTAKPGVAICSGALRSEAVAALKRVAQDQQSRLWIVPPPTSAAP